MQLSSFGSAGGCNFRGGPLDTTPSPSQRRRPLSPVDPDFDGASPRELTPSRSGQSLGLMGLEYPQWLFPVHFSDDVKALLIELLDPDPQNRPSVAESMEHPWVKAAVDEYEGSVNLLEISGTPSMDDDDIDAQAIAEEVPVPTMLCGSAPVSSSPVYRAMAAAADYESAADTVKDDDSIRRCGSTLVPNKPHAY